RVGEDRRDGAVLQDLDARGRQVGPSPPPFPRPVTREGPAAQAQPVAEPGWIEHGKSPLLTLACGTRRTILLRARRPDARAFQGAKAAGWSYCTAKLRANGSLNRP